MQWLNDKVSNLRQQLINDPDNKLLQIEYNNKLEEQAAAKALLDKSFK